MPLAWSEAGAGRPLVLLHGFPFDRSIWDSQREQLSQTYRVLTPDLRGHGQSPGFLGPTSIDVLANDVLEFLTERGILGPVALGGLSMGGYVALSIAARHYERLSALLLIDTRAGADSPEAARNRCALADRVDTDGSGKAVVEAFVPRLFAPTTFAEQPEVVAMVRAMMERTDPRTLSTCLRAMADRPDRTEDLPQIAVPTAVIVGADDLISTPQEAQDIADRLPNAEVTVIPRAGHLACVENPTAVNAAIASLLERVFRV